MHRDLGLYAEGEPHLKRCLELRQTLLGPEHSDTLRAIDKLGKLYIFWEKIDQAEELLTGNHDALSGRWDDTLKRVRSSLATDRRRLWKWQAPDIPSELKAAAPAKNDQEQHQQNQILATTPA